MVPLAGLEVLQTLIISKLLPEHIIDSVLYLVLKLQFVLFSHLHLDSFLSLLLLVAIELLDVDLLGLLLLQVFVLHVFVVLLVLLFFLDCLRLFILSLEF